MTAKGRLRRQPPSGIVRKLDSSLLAEVHAGRVLDGGEDLLLEKNRLPLPTAECGAIGRQVVQFHIEQ